MKAAQEGCEMLAVAVRGESVAPRFCSANEFLLAELGHEQVRSIRRITFPEEGWLQRLERLSATGVKVLLCGGFNSGLRLIAEKLRIRVFSDLAGKAEPLIDAFLRNELDRYELRPYRRAQAERCPLQAGPMGADIKGSDGLRRKGERRRSRWTGLPSALRARDGA